MFHWECVYCIERIVLFWPFISPRVTLVALQINLLKVGLWIFDLHYKWPLVYWMYVDYLYTMDSSLGHDISNTINLYFSIFGMSTTNKLLTSN